MQLQDDPHKRYNPLTGEWVLVSPHRTKRPWHGKVESLKKEQRPRHDPDCYLCPGNLRAGGIKNPQYTDTFSFVNDFSALLPDTGEGALNKADLLIAGNEKGICKVICFSPRHDLTLPRMEKSEIEKVIRLWVREYQELGHKDFIKYVQIFENRGEIMGCSNQHPHGQLWSNSTIPLYPAVETEKQSVYFKKRGTCLLCDYVALEIQEKERVVFENDSFIVLVPFWAFWPFETMLLPKQHLASIVELDDGLIRDLGNALKRLGIRYDNLFLTSFPYSMGIHQRPTDGREYPGWHFHFHYYPPLLRSATVKKFMVGYEMLAMPQRDITAEGAALRLRELSEIHYDYEG
ncbi:MAG: UDP-glucose--hexose-1-phosphate uridylyltransferase [Spirochaetota bacterium]